MIINATEGNNLKSLDIAEHYTLTDELFQLIEETAELIVAVCHDRRKNADGVKDYIARFNLLEETADTLVMLERVGSLLDLPVGNIESLRDAKLDRELKRIETRKEK